MSESSAPQNDRSYGCTLGCGNPYDVIVILVADADTTFLCMPCYVRVASDVLEAFINGSDPAIQNALRAVGTPAGTVVPGPNGKPRGKNAPVGTTDDGVLSDFDMTITAEELSDEFK